MASVPQLRFGIVGMTSDHVWGMGDGLAALPGVVLVAGAEPYPELRQQAQQRWGLERTYEDERRMLADEQLDALLLCGDNAGKAGIVEEAARRGLHVYQDKPMAATLAQADRMLRAAEAAGIVYMVAYHSAFSPTYDQVKALLHAGAVGQVYLARGATGHAGPAEIGCSRYFQEWLFDKGRNGGGAFVDEACYLLDTFLDYVGPLAEVSAFTTQMGHRTYLPPDVEDNAVAILRFASGALGVIDAKWGQVGPAPVRTSYHGTGGTLVTGAAGAELYSVEDAAPPDEWEALEPPAGRGGRPQVGLRAWRAPAVAAAGAGRGGAEQRAFVDCVRRGRQVEGAASPRLARDVQEAIEAVYRSAESGRAVRLPLAG
jgi:predicted dehydrogenase